MAHSYGHFRLVNASDVCLFVQKTYGVSLKPGTIRQWAARRKLPQHGHKRERYDLQEVVEFLERRRIIPPGDAENRGIDDGADPRDSAGR